MTDYSSTLTHENRQRYQTIDTLKEWDLNSYQPSALTHAHGAPAPGKFLIIEGLFNSQARQTAQLLKWADTLRRASQETLFDEANRHHLIKETRVNLKTLRRYDEVQETLPLLRELLKTYAKHPVATRSTQENILDFVKVVCEAFHEKSVKKEIDDHQHNQRKGLKNDIEKVKTDLQHHHCLTFIHLLLQRDIYTRQTHQPHQPDQKSLFVQWRKDLFAACRQGREPPFVDLVRYYWRIVDDLEQGPRLWIIMAFAPPAPPPSAPRHETVEERVQQLREIWQERITGGWGAALTHHSANNVQHPRSSQLGLVCRDDAQAIKRLQRLMYTLENLSYLGYLQDYPNYVETSKGTRRQRARGNGKGKAAQAKG